MGREEPDPFFCLPLPLGLQATCLARHCKENEGNNPHESLNWPGVRAEDALARAWPLKGKGRGRSVAVRGPCFLLAGSSCL